MSNVRALETGLTAALRGHSPRGRAGEHVPPTAPPSTAALAVSVPEQLQKAARKAAKTVKKRPAKAAALNPLF